MPIPHNPQSNGEALKIFYKKQNFVEIVTFPRNPLTPDKSQVILYYIIIITVKFLIRNQFQQ
jgi:hypothetical protein